jgi:hypothetical protein
LPAPTIVILLLLTEISLKKCRISPDYKQKQAFCYENLPPPRYNNDMTEKDYDNSLHENEQANEITDDEFIPPDARPVCPNCFQPCSPLQNYCDNCNSNQVINPLASYMPFVNIRFNYDIFLTMLRKITHRNVSGLRKGLYLFAIVIFAPVFALGLPFLLAAKIKNPLFKNILIAAICIIILALIIFLLLLKIKTLH